MRAMQPYYPHYQPEQQEYAAVPVQFRRRRRRFDSPEDIARLLIPFIYPYYYYPYPYYPPRYYPPYYYPYNPYYPYGGYGPVANIEGEAESV